jgi:hypothetical protein
MSAYASQIFSAIDDICQSVCSDYVKLRRVYDVSQNDARNISKAYGIIHGEAENTDGVTRFYTLDQKFEIVLVNRAVDRDNDADIQAVINTMYDKAESLFNQIFLSKLGLPAIVLIVDNPSMSKPQILENGAAILVLSFNVKYRKAIA